MSIIAIPTQGNRGLDDRICENFGKAPTFTLLNTDTGGLTIFDNTSDHMGGKVGPPELVRSIGADTITVSSLGAKDAKRCSELGITVLCGASGSVREVLEQVRGGTLSPPPLGR